MKTSPALITAIGSVALWAAAPASAQNTTDTTTTYPAQDNHDDHGKWGLLGLLGLAGLLGLKRRDHDHARDDNRRTTSSTNRP